LAWLLGNENAGLVRRALAGAEVVFASDLTVLECNRVLVRCILNGELSEAEGADRAALLAEVAAHWALLRINEEVLERAGRRFPAEPLRSLDAIHLASALVARKAAASVELLSLDRRLRGCGKLLGLRIVPNLE
jgi:predicted nucleic acid-binding protein